MQVKPCSSKSTLVDKSLTKALGIKKSITVFFVCFTYFSMWLGNILQMDFLRRRRNFFKFCTFQCRESIFNFRTTNISGGSRNYRTRHSHSHNTHSNVPSSPIFSQYRFCSQSEFMLFSQLILSSSSSFAFKYGIFILYWSLKIIKYHFGTFSSLLSALSVHLPFPSDCHCAH